LLTYTKTTHGDKMQKVLFGLVTGLALSVASAQAGLFDQIATSNWPSKESKAYKVEAYGFDFRVYEWQTESDENTFCTVAIGNADHAPYMGMECFQKTQ
jgi:hypothetical protein